MSRLFLRIFLWFWLGSTCLVLVFAASLVMAQPDVVATWRFIGRTSMRYLGAHAAEVYERQGPAAAQQLLAGVIREGRFNAWLYALDGSLIAGPSPIAGARDIIETARLTDNAERVGSGSAVLLAGRVASQAGREYVLMWEAPVPLRGALQVSPWRLSLRAGALIVTAGLVCWILTWQITTPIRTLRAAARRFADGDLSVRVGDSPSLRRRDELSDLAREFDQMAARIEHLIESEQQLLADISHELRSPLARMALALDLARNRLGAGVPEHDRIARDIQRLNELIEQLLTMARLRARTDPPLLASLDLVELVRDVVRDARFEAAATGKTVSLQAPGPAAVSGNRALLRSAVENVVRNAVRHTPEGGDVAITVTRPDDTGRVEIAVRDQGSGVPEAVLERLFDPFFRVDGARDRLAGGVGLGLSITRQALLAHGGDVTAANHAEGGLVVRLELPTGPPAAATPPS
ncbi:MAG: sensor histidine kinase [Vicinamibacterales bacterium]